MKGYVVVLFGQPEPSWCDLSNCPLGGAYFFETKVEAEAYCGVVPEGFQPHILTVERCDV